MGVIEKQDNRDGVDGSLSNGLEAARVWQVGVYMCGLYKSGGGGRGGGKSGGGNHSHGNHTVIRFFFVR